MSQSTMTLPTSTCALQATTCSPEAEPVSRTSGAVSSDGRRAAVRRACQRGMVTAEYAVGILAACALAVTLMKVFNDKEFFGVLLKQITALIGQLSAQIPG